MFAPGAVGVKIWQEIGLVIKDRAGKLILSDDPMFTHAGARVQAFRLPRAVLEIFSHDNAVRIFRLEPARAPAK